MFAGFQDVCFVFEMGTERGEPHLHYFIKTAKSRNTVVNVFKRVFHLPSDRGQRYSMKVADQAKLPSYFVYLAKGMHGKRGDPVVVAYEAEPRMWDALHTQYHDVAAARASPAAKADWFAAIADELKAARLVSKDDVLQRVTRYYVYESKKGFDKFMVIRTFWRVWSLVNAADAHQSLLDSCLESLRP